MIIMLTKQPADCRYEDILDKLKEEQQEFEDALLDHRTYGKPPFRANLISEAFDVLQMALVLLNRVLKDTGADGDAEAERHLQKLITRGWAVDGFVKLDIAK